MSGQDGIADAASSRTAFFALYDGNVLQTVCGVLIIASIAGAFINVLPYFFYDLTELKQQGMVKVLKIRAFFEDFGNNTLSDDSLVEVVEMVDSAKKLINEEVEKVTKDEIKAAKKAKDKAAVSTAKQARTAKIASNLEIQLAPFV